MLKIAYQAHASNYGAITADTPQRAALNFFNKFPKARKCNIIEGDYDGQCFSVSYSAVHWPKSWKDVTKKSLVDLPDNY